MKTNTQVETLFKELVEGVQRFYSSETWKTFLTFQAKFHTYSFSNVVLIWMQCPHASHVAGFSKWKEVGRRVKKGEKAIILSHVTKKKIRYVDVPSNSFRQTLQHVGMADEIIEAMLDNFEIIKSNKFGYTPEVSPMVEEITGQKAISFETFARDNQSFFVQKES